MPTFNIDAPPDQGTGRIDSRGRLKFGRLTVEYSQNRNRFLLSDPNRIDSMVLLNESDVPQVLAYVLAHFKPVSKQVVLLDDWRNERRRLYRALCVADRVFTNVAGWTSKHCLDCVSQRDRADKAREVLSLMFGGDVQLRLIDEDSNSYGEACELADMIHEFVLNRRAQR